MVIELMSESAADFDKTEKKRIYQDKLQAPEYFLYDPFEDEALIIVSATRKRRPQT